MPQEVPGKVTALINPWFQHYLIKDTNSLRAQTFLFKSTAVFCIQPTHIQLPAVLVKVLSSDLSL